MKGCRQSPEMSPSSLLWPESLTISELLSYIGPTRYSNTQPFFKEKQHFLTLCILMDFPIHVDAISMGLPIVYFNGVTHSSR